jgi:hypothetical protein
VLKARFDLGRNGEIDAGGWESARCAARQEFARSVSRAELPPAVDALVDTGDTHHPYLLAADTEARVRQRVERLTLVCGVLASAGALLILSCVLARLSAA